MDLLTAEGVREVDGHFVKRGEGSARYRIRIFLVRSTTLGTTPVNFFPTLSTHYFTSSTVATHIGPKSTQNHDHGATKESRAPGRRIVWRRENRYE